MRTALCLLALVCGCAPQPVAENSPSQPPLEGLRSLPKEMAEKPEAAPPLKGTGIQQERKELIEDLMSKGVFKSAKQTSPDIVHLVVTPTFMMLDFDQKNTFVGVVYAYYFDSTDERNMVLLEHSKTNKRVGVFSALHAGLHLD